MPTVMHALGMDLRDQDALHRMLQRPAIRNFLFRNAEALVRVASAEAPADAAVVDEALAWRDELVALADVRHES